MGRSDDMLIIKGVNVFPSQIETVLINKGYPANYQIVVGRVKNSDTLDIQVEMTNEMFSDSMSTVSAKEKDWMRPSSPCWAFMPMSAGCSQNLTRSEGKAVRIIDNRNLY